MQKTFKGKIVSIKQNKTVIVEVVRKTAHPLYKKLLTVSKKYQVGSGDKQYNLGDVVTIGETRPVSKTKNFVVVEEKK